MRRLALLCVVAVLAPSACDRTSNRDAGASIKINEVMARNRASGFLDPNGVPLDWVEIYNPGPEAVSLAGFSLSDNPDRPTKYRFPSAELGAGEFLVVFLASAGDRAEFEATLLDGEPRVFHLSDLHADFGISPIDDRLFLYRADGSVLVDRVEIHHLPPT